MPRASTTQICETCLAQLEEPPRGLPDVLAPITLGSGIGVEHVHEDFECGNVAPRARHRERARRMPRKERWKLRWPCSDVGRRLKTHTPRRPSFVKYLAQRGEASANKGGEWRRVHDVLLYEVQSAGQQAELYAIEL